MRFDHPWWLLALVPAAATVVAVARAGRRTVPRRQHSIAVAARLVAVVLLVVAAAGPIVELPVDDRSVAFLVDRSESIGVGGRALQEQVVEEALQAARPVDASSVVVFGADVRTDSALGAGRTSVGIRTEVDGSGTDLGGAIRAAAALLPTAGSRRIVILSDLVETTGSARAAAREIAKRGITIDVVSIGTSRPTDALIESVRMPPVIRRGEQANATVVVDSAVSGSGRLVVDAGSGSTRSIPVRLEPGRSEVTVPVEPGDEGFVTVTARLELEGDARPENDEAAGISRVLGPARIAIVEGVAGEADQLAAALRAGGLEVDVRAAIPPAEQLLGYDAVVLVDVPAPDADAASDLGSYVEDLGRGMVVVGGQQSYGLGDYQDSPLETLLPVASNPDDLIRRQTVAEVLVIDTSGSMANCHCNSGEFEEGGVNKTDISRAGAALAIEALADSDRVGVMAVSSGFDWVLPLGPKPDKATAQEALGSLFPSGDTEIARGLEAALTELDSASESLRHIVLFTDGWDPNDANLVPLARRIADSGITLSVLGTGEGAGTTLQRMADVGGGRYYPGRDLAEVPEIFAEETLTVARNLAVEGSFLPALRAPSPATRGLTAAPPLLGYVVTKAKGTASVGLEIGPGDPLLASWQRGLGRVSTWASDATTRWADPWVDWDGFTGFWGAVVRDVVPPGRDRAPEVFVDAGDLRITVDGTDEDLGARATARVRTPDGSTVVVPLRRTSSTVFDGFTPVSSPGAYWVAVTIDRPDGSSTTVTGGAVSSYRQEFAFREADPTLGADLAAITGGRLDPGPGSLFDPGPRSGADDRPITPWLVAAALAAFFADVALRRLDFGAGDAAAWREGMESQTRRERKRVAEATVAEPEARPDVLSESETLRRLMRRKRR